MALINTGSDYTRTGENFLTRWGNRFSFIPYMGAPIAGFLGMAGTLVETAGWLFRGKIGSAATVLVAGAVSAGINSASSIFQPLEGVRWWLNAGSGVATGSTLGTHGRALTEGIIGSVTGALGVKPTVLRSYTAGVGSIGGMQSGPGQFASAEASRRGQDPNAMYNNYRAGNQQDYQALVNAQRAQGVNTARG